MDASNRLIIVKGKDKTDSIASFRMRGNKCEIIYDNSSQVFSYNKCNVRIISLKRIIDPQTVIFKYNGKIITDISSIRDFGEFYRVICSKGKSLSCKVTQVQISDNCLANDQCNEIFSYFKETASAVSLKTENGINILSQQFDKIAGVDNSTALFQFINPDYTLEKQPSLPSFIFPFGLNQSQKKAVERAFSNQVSIIQGPPGTGKTQTILNIVANAVRNGQSIAVVSNNNTAVLNVKEKLEKYDLGFLSAFLGNSQNKKSFLETQSGLYPNMESWMIDSKKKEKLDKEVSHLLEKLNTMLLSKNRIAEIDQELLELKPEQFYFKDYYKRTRQGNIDICRLSKLKPQKILSLWLEYEHNFDQQIGFLKKLLLSISFCPGVSKLFKHLPEEVIPFIQDLYYKARIIELQNERSALEKKLNNYHFEQRMQELSDKSMVLFKAELSCRYQWKQPRKTFADNAFLGISETTEFIKEYPVILSTTYSIKGTLAKEQVYDILVVDEASQVDLVTGVLAFSCAKNIVIVGDQKQLPNVLTTEDICVANAIWNKYNLDDRYCFSSHSMLDSSTEIWKDVPMTLLREHYRCHPKIANFFNQKFYNNELVLMKEDHGEKDVLSMYRTVPGNHARGHFNQRQIDVVQKEILPMLYDQGYHDIGIITPYRDQVSALQQQLGDTYDISTVHKFQGREKESIVLLSVDNVIGEFVDNPNLLNVAVSRAVKSLSVVISNSEENDKTNYGDLAKYIEYNYFQIKDSQISSVFDMLYKGYYEQRQVFLKKHNRISLLLY